VISTYAWHRFRVFFDSFHRHDVRFEVTEEKKRKKTQFLKKKHKLYRIPYLERKKYLVHVTNMLRAPVICSAYEIDKPTRPGSNVSLAITANVAANKITKFPRVSSLICNHLEEINPPIPLVFTLVSANVNKNWKLNPVT